MERTLDQRLDHLKSELLKMGGIVEDSIAEAVRSLVDRDNDLAQKVIDGGDEVDDREVEIEEECLKLLAMQQPVARDLRLIATTMKINYDLERINDQAVNIGQRALVLNELPMLSTSLGCSRSKNFASACSSRTSATSSSESTSMATSTSPCRRPPESMESDSS